MREKRRNEGRREGEKERKNEKQKNTRAAVSMADKSHSEDKVGTNMFLIVSQGPQQLWRGCQVRRAQMSEIFMFTKTPIQDGRITLHGPFSCGRLVCRKTQAPWSVY